VCSRSTASSRCRVASAIRVGGTRVTLDTVVAAFVAGATAEEIVQQYPSVTLADVYSVIGYYLRHQSEVRTYLTDRQKETRADPRPHAADVDEDFERIRLGQVTGPIFW